MYELLDISILKPGEIFHAKLLSWDEIKTLIEEDYNIIDRNDFFIVEKLGFHIWPDMIEKMGNGRFYEFIKSKESHQEDVRFSDIWCRDSGYSYCAFWLDLKNEFIKEDEFKI